MISSAEYLNRIPFYFWWAGVLGITVNLAVQLLLNPHTAQSLVARWKAARLDAVETSLRRLADGGTGKPQRENLITLVVAGTGKTLTLLKLGSMFEPWTRQNQAALRAQIILLDRLVTASAVLEVEVIGAVDAATRGRMLRVADACCAWRLAIENRYKSTAFNAREGLEWVPASESVLPSLSEMERLIQLAPSTFPGQRLPDELKANRAEKGGLFVPDAFTNPEYIQFAIKGALPAFICYLIFTLTAYQGIYTSVITCIVCSVGTIGATVQKGILRFAGAAVGGALGIISLLYVFPKLDSICGFWIPFAAVTCLAAYVLFGSPRISYCGFQIGLAFYKCVLQDYGPYTELRVARDRLIGILLGLSVFGIVNSRLWPVRALETIETHLAAVFRSLSKLAALPSRGDCAAPESVETSDLRQRVRQDLGAIDDLLVSAKYEFDGSRHRNLEKARDRAQELFLCLLAIVQRRPDLRPNDAPEPLRGAAAHFRSTLGEALLNLSKRLEGKPGGLAPDLSAALSDLERTVASQIGAVRDSNIAAEIRARLGLYHEAIPIIQEVFELQAG
jgi:multidrug resistance protein MdtO